MKLNGIIFMPFQEANALVRGPTVKSVGSKGAKNLAIDVALVQNLLNIVAKLPEAKRKTFYDKKVASTTIHTTQKSSVRSKVVTPLIVNGKCGNDTIQRIKDFQGEFLSFTPDGNISASGKTWDKLVKVSQVNINSGNKRQLVLGTSPVIPQLINVDKARLYSTIKSHLYLVNKDEECSKFIDNLLTDPTLTNLQWAAYYLATTYHETIYTFKPIIEADKGKGRAYDKAISVTDTAGILGTKGKTYSNTFYGRGFVQLTHGDAYKYISEKIGLKKDELYVNPDKALEPAIAYNILTYWMQNDIPKVKGRGRKIQEFITAGSVPDYKGARAIVNKNDLDTRIANYAIVFELLLILCCR